MQGRSPLAKRVTRVEDLRGPFPVSVSPILPRVAQDAVWESSMAGALEESEAVGHASPSPPTQLVLAQDTAPGSRCPSRETSGARPHRGQRFQGAAYVHRPLLGEKPDDMDAFPFAVQEPQILIRLQKSRGILDKSHSSLARSSRRLKRLT